ncbi:MAG: hypothetical protein KME08_09630 [Aphanothece sp. CMT-3BRIN-NPC111]|jgi:hypothetical protein|nr:hypothetical protein [Aphanothece sp. CMT-3BRIN-NPC111]
MREKTRWWFQKIYLTPFMKLPFFISKNHSALFAQAAILFLIGVASRLPFQSHILHDMDSYNFARALDRFDVRLEQPHTPGTFFIYIVMGRLLKLFLHDPNASLVGVNILATGFAAAAIFILGSTWFGILAGWVIALLMLTSPLVWFQGEVALSYMPEFCWVLTIVLACCQVRLGNKTALFISAALMGLAGGIRPNTPFFLFPLWVVAVALGLRTRKYNLWHFIWALVLLIICIGMWAVPMVMLSGGPSGYWQAMQPWFTKHPKDGNTLNGKYRNLKLVIESVFYGVGFAFLPTFWALRHNWRYFKTKLLRYWRFQTLILWILPGFLYLTFIHIQQRGHTFTIMPAFIVIAGISIILAGRYLQQFRRNSLVILTILVLAGNSLFFLFGPANLDRVPTWATIRDYDTYITERLELIRKEFPQTRETIVLPSGRNMAMRSFYLPEYEGISDLTEVPIVLPNHVNTLVLFDQKVLREFQAESGFQLLSLPTTGSIRYITWKHNQQVKVSKSSFEIKDSSKSTAL